jgi:hypothetical protein
MRTTVAIVLAVAPVPATAQDWEFSLTPYFMAPSMDGSSAVGPLEVDVAASPADIFDNLNWGAMAMLEANNGRFGVAIDATYMNLEAEREGFLEEIGGHQGAYTGMVLARVHPYAEAYAGARVNDLGVRLQATGPLGVVRTASASKTWVDPLVGMRVTLPVSGKTDLTILADVGGLGISSDIAIQAWPSFGIRLGNKVKAQLGYRMIYTAYDSGTGLRRFEYDILAHGPTAGVQFRF